MKVHQTTQTTVLNKLLAPQFIHDSTAFELPDGLTAPIEIHDIQPITQLSLPKTFTQDSLAKAEVIVEMEPTLLPKGAIAPPPLGHHLFEIPDLGFILDQGDNPGSAIAVMGVAKIIGQVFKGMVKFMKFADQVINGPGVSIADVVTANHGLLMEIKDTLEDLTVQLNTKLDEIIEGIESLSEQINTNLISEVITGAFNIFDKVIEYRNPTNNQLEEIQSLGLELMNQALAAAENVAEDAPAAFIAGQIAPSLMMATAARIASVIYASDEGLGQSTVQNDLAAAAQLLQSIYSETGALGQQIREEVEYEIFSVHGFSGSHVFEFAVAGTVTGPGGAVTHNVAAYHGYNAGQPVGNPFPNYYSRGGTINGVDANTDPFGASAELASLTVDHVVPFTGDHVSELNSAFNWVENQNNAVVTAIVERDLLNFGDDQVNLFTNGLPSTAGFNEGDRGGSGDDHITAYQGSGDVFFTAPDLMLGGGGNDTLEGLGERDSLFGEAGNDYLFGGDDNDKLFGGSGSDFLDGEAGHDHLEGHSGRDTLEGGNGHDALFQSERGDFYGHDDPGNFSQLAADGGYLSGEGGNDLLVGDNGGDVIRGGTGHDTAYGYGGNDAIYGDAGNDFLVAGAGDDTLFGGSGNDRIEGEAGNDEIDGSFGDDTIIGGGGNDTITGGYGVDTVVYYGLQSDYTWTQAANGTWTVTDIRLAPSDGIDTLLDGISIGQQGLGYGVEFLQFDDGLVELTPPSGIDGPQFTAGL